MPICPYLAIWAYGHMGICKKIWPNGVSPKRESKMQLRDVNQRSLGHSNQKLWPKVDLGEFHHVYPLEHLKSFATDRLWVYNAENFFVAFSRYIYSAVSTIKQNFKKWLFWDTLLCILLCKRVEDTFENAQWRKVKQMPPMWLCILSGRRFDDAFENTQ